MGRLDVSRTANITPGQLRHLLRTARHHALAVALHSIGDDAVGIGLDAFVRDAR